MTHVLASVVPLIALTAACAGNDDGSGSMDEQDLRFGRRASGYDFGGPKALPANKVASEVCAAIESAERAACAQVKGELRRANGCVVLCSKPIAETGKTAGYDFEGFEVVPNDGTPVNCAAAVTPEQEACAKVGGETSPFGCSVLCSKPIARKGYVAGYDFGGFKIEPVSETPKTCPAMTSLVGPACVAVQGTPVDTDCDMLCSLPL